MEAKTQFFPSMNRTQSQPQFKTQKAGEIYRIHKKIKLRDDELPFTNALNKIKSPKFDSAIMSKCNDVLQKTYYNTAHPPNRKPLEKLKCASSLATTNPILDKINNTKICQYSEAYIKAVQKLNTMEEALDSDITQSIKKASSVADFYKNYGYFFISKTSQNYVNTVESLANYDKSKVLELNEWFSHKIDSKKANGNNYIFILIGSDYKQAIQHDKTIQDPDLLLKSRLIQNSELLVPTTSQLKSVLKQKAEMFQLGKTLDLKMQDTQKTIAELRKISQTKIEQEQTLPELTGILRRGTTKLKASDIKNLEQEYQTHKELSNDDIIMPLKKKKMWELKEKATAMEVKLQYTVSKLEEQMQEMKDKLEGMRKENCDLSERVKIKYGGKLLDIRSEFEMVSHQYTENVSDSSKSKLSQSLNASKKKGKVEDFMKAKAQRDQLNQKKQKVFAKVELCNERIQTNVQRIHMLEFEVEHIKRDIASTKQEQIDHYQNLLKQGIDARKDGLIWIIKALWLLGQDVQIHCMPRFLDSECIKFLLEFAKLDIKRTELHEMLKELKFQARKDRISNVFKQKAMNSTINFVQSPGMPGNLSPEKKLSIFQPQHQSLKQKSVSKRELFSQKTKEAILRQTKEKLHQLSQTLQAVNMSQEDPEEIEILMQLQEQGESPSRSISDDEQSIEEQDPYLTKFSNIERTSPFRRSETLVDVGISPQQLEQADEKTLEQDIKILEKRYNNLKNKMKNMKNHQLDRIGREFLLNNYEKRFKVSQEVVLAAIVGEDKAKSALANQMKRIEEYKRVIEKNRTFTFGSLRQSTTPWQRATITSLKQ